MVVGFEKTFLFLFMVVVLLTVTTSVLADSWYYVNLYNNSYYTVDFYVDGDFVGTCWSGYHLENVKVWAGSHIFRAFYPDGSSTYCGVYVNYDGYAWSIP